MADMSLSPEHQRLIETVEEYATVYGPERDGEHGRIFREATRALALKLARLERLEERLEEARRRRREQVREYQLPAREEETT